MGDNSSIYDPALADGRFQLETLGIRWLLVCLYGLFVGVGMVEVDMTWFIASEGFLVAFHVYYTWYVWRELGPRPLPPATAYATPFLDTGAVTLALIAVGDPFHPIWAVYFFIIVGVGFFYYPVIRIFGVWLLTCYGFVGLGLYSQGLDVPLAKMGVAAVILTLGVFNLAAYTGGERRLRGRLSETARTDPLTGLLNRRGLEEVMLPSGDDVPRRRPAVAVFMLDVDRFKRFNDQYGHLTADRVLEHLADIIKEAVRDPDLVARYGGDEFVVIMPDVNQEDSVKLAERLREQVARLGLCTVSIGVAHWEGPETSPEEVLTQADTALLAAKQAGRNCVRAYGDADVAAA